MEHNQSKSFEQIIRFQKKDARKTKSKMMSSSKGKKVNSFKSSLEKLFRIKSKSEKSVRADDLKLDIIPQTIYLTPQQTVSLSRDIEKIQQILPIARQSKLRLSCSDFVTRQSSTFRSPGNIATLDGAVSPTKKSYHTVTETKCFSDDCLPPGHISVPHSKSIPVHLSKSHQNITKSNKEDCNCQRPAKRIVRKKGLFNCSLFRKKSSDKVNELRGKPVQIRDQSKSLNRSDLRNQSELSDRCLTLPNLKSSEVDLIQSSDNHRLLSMDLIKDYINRSNSSLQLSVQGDPIDSISTKLSQCYTASVHNSPPILSNSDRDRKKVKSSLKTGFREAVVSDHHHFKESFCSHKCASTNVTHSRCCRATSPLSADVNVFDKTCNRYPHVSSTSDENQKPPFLKQFSAPIYCPQTQPQHQYLSSQPTNSAFDFWTRPFQEKMKASRRRLMDDKVGSKEALLRSLSPQNIKTCDGNPIFDHSFPLHMIPEPLTVRSIDSHTEDCLQGCQLSHSKSFYSSVQCRPINPDGIFRLRTSSSMVVKNRLVESPKSRAGNHICGNNLICTEVREHETGKPTYTVNEVVLGKKEGKLTDYDKILPSRTANFEESLSEARDNKSINSSTELVLTRTPTPPHSFAESPVSSIYPAPNEFISEITKSKSHPNRLCCNTNLLYASDNSDDDQPDEISRIDIEPIPPIPPPRTDSVLRSLHVDQSELDEFPPIFSGANIEHCDIEQYHKWLEKLPYKTSEFPNLNQCRRSSIGTITEAVSAETKANNNSKKIDLSTLKQSKQPRKEVKSWNVSEHIKQRESINCKQPDSTPMKKSHSYDQYLDKHGLGSTMEKASITDVNTNIPAHDCTLLKQYSHLYSLKPSPSQANVMNDITPKSVQRFCRSKSIDFRNLANHVSNRSLLEKGTGIGQQNRKSVPNENLDYGQMSKVVSGNLS